MSPRGAPGRGTHGQGGRSPLCIAQLLQLTPAQKEWNQLQRLSQTLPGISQLCFDEKKVIYLKTRHLLL